MQKSFAYAFGILATMWCLQTSSSAACPGTSLTNGTPADANQVMAWLNCKASLDGSVFTGGVSISAPSGAALLANTSSGWSVMGHGDYASFLDTSNKRGITIITSLTATQLYSDYFTATSANPLQLGAVPNITAINIWPSGNVGLGVVDPANVRLSVFGSEIGTGLPANSGTLAVANLRVNDRSNIALDVGQYNPADAAWIQVHDSTNQAVSYPLALQLNGGNVGVGTISPAQKLEVVGFIRQSGCTTAGTLAVNGAGDIICSSDARLKNVLGPYHGGLDVIAQIEPQLFTYKSTAKNPNETFVHAGFIAQNVRAAIPQSSALQRDGYYSLDTTAILAASVNALKEVRSRLEAKGREVSHLNMEMGTQKKLIAALSARLTQVERMERLKTASR